MEKNGLEIEVNFIDMFWALCLKWRYIIVWAIVMAALAGGVGYYRSWNSVQKSKDETVSSEDIKLSDDEQKRVDLYLKYMDEYNNQLAYNNQAPLMQIDANGFYEGTVSFYVNNHYTVEYPQMDKANNINAITDAYKTELRSEEFKENLEKVMQTDGQKEASYYYDVIDFSNKFDNDDVTTLQNKDFLVVKIYAPDEEECKALAELVINEINSKKASVSTAIGEHDITLMENACLYTANSDVLTYQKENLDKLYVFQKTIKEFKASLNEAESSYIKTFLNDQEKLDESQENAQETTTVTVTVGKKIILKGFIVGAFIALFISALTYLLNHKIRIEDDIEKLFRIKLLGRVIADKEHKKKWFGFIDKAFIKLRHLNKHYLNENDAVKVIAAEIMVSAKKTKIDKVYITGAVLDQKVMNIIEKIKSEMKTSGIIIEGGESVLYSPEAIKSIAEAGQTIFVESAGASLYNDILDEVSICRWQDTKIIGIAVIQ